MTFTNAEIVSMYNKLTELLNNQEIKFSAKVSYNILRNFKTLSPIVEDIQTTREDIINKYGEPAEDEPGMFKAKEGCEVDMTKELFELSLVENEVELRKVKLDDILNANLSLSDMDALYLMIEEDEEG